MSRGPKYRLVFKDSDGENHPCGAIWESEQGYLSLSPVTEPNEEYGEMSLADVLEAQDKDGGFINLFENKPKNGKKKRRRSDDAESDFD